MLASYKEVKERLKLIGSGEIFRLNDVELTVRIMVMMVMVMAIVMVLMMHLVGLISETMRSISVTEETRTKS